MFDFLHLGFPARFAHKPPAAACAAAPRSRRVALQVPFKEAGGVPMVAFTANSVPPYSRLRLAEAEAQVLKSIQFLAGDQELQKIRLGCTEINTTGLKPVFSPASGKYFCTHISVLSVATFIIIGIIFRNWVVMF